MLLATWAYTIPIAGSYTISVTRAHSFAIAGTYAIPIS